ncbi:MAG: hypothetical protein ACKVRO_19635 [Micropepsaceae bacterium]
MRFLAGLLFMALATAPVLADGPDKLDGWGGLRFGMTVDEAQGIVGRTWSKPEQVNVQTQPGETAVWTILRSKGQVDFGGKSFDLEVTLDDKGGLNQIKLARQEPADTFALCDGAFAKLLAEGERQFGSFRPVQPAHAERRDAGKEKRTETAAWMTMIEHRPLPQGKSVYQHLLIKWRKTSERPWHIYHIDNAVRPFGASYVELTATLSAKEPCELRLGFAADPYPFEKMKGSP